MIKSNFVYHVKHSTAYIKDAYFHQDPAIHKVYERKNQKKSQNVKNSIKKNRKQ